MTTDHDPGTPGDAGAASQATDAPVAGRLLTVPEVAALLHLSEAVVRRWLTTGHIRSVLLADDVGWRVPEAEVERLLATADRSTTAGQEPGRGSA